MIDGNTVILLGAGASVSAGVPTSNDIPKRMIDQLSHSPMEMQKLAHQALNFAVGGLRFQKAQSGEGAYSAVNIEEVFNAIDLLSRRQKLEFAPFVAAWHPSVEAIDSSSGASAHSVLSLGRSLEDFLLKGRSSFSFERDFVKAVKSITNSGGGNGFSTTLSVMRQLLLNMTWLDAAANVGYLNLLTEYAVRNDATIVTLNYDNSVELSCANQALIVDTGVEKWSLEGAVRFNTDTVKLIKLHGSVNWIKIEPALTAESPLRNFQIKVLDHLNKPQFSGGENTYLIFGSHNKLTAEGPFLDLFKMFETKLHQATEVIVVGYSFADPHVNRLLINWINGNTERTIKIANGPNFDISATSIFTSHSLKLLGARIVNTGLYAEEGIEYLFSPSHDASGL